MIRLFGSLEQKIIQDWVHVSYVSEDANRRRCLQAYKENKKNKI